MIRSQNLENEILLPYGKQDLVVRIPEKNLQAVLVPRSDFAKPDPSVEIRRALNNPIGFVHLSNAVKKVRKVVIIVDDITRQTPLKLIIPELMEDLALAGIHDEQITILIALGTHRPMTHSEIATHFGKTITGRVNIVNHPWQDPAQLVDLGDTPNGTPVKISRLALEADFLIGIGSIVPHHIPGFSGGAKIIQPGISGDVTTGSTHFLSTRTRRSYLGLVENPVREEMEMIAEQVGLKVIFNVVLSPTGELLKAFFGNFRETFQNGVEFSRQVYGIPYKQQADIVIAGSHPCDIEFWQAHKSLYPADMLVRDGGSIIVVTPCPEGVSRTHQAMLNYTSLDADQIEKLILSGEIHDMTSGALALAWAKVRQRASISIVSGGISKEESDALGFTKYDSVEDALQSAIECHGPQSTVSILPYAPDTLPIRVS